MPLEPHVTARLQYELEMIERLGFSAYFLIVAEIAAWARGEGISINARGSASDSLVAYALGISGVDPIAHDLMFERFLNPYRSDPPDIDLDICWRRRDALLEHVYNTYGRDSVAMIGTHISFALNSAWRDVGKVLGLAPADIGRISTALPRGHSVADLDDEDAPPEWLAFRSRNSVQQGLRDCDTLDESLADVAAIMGKPRHLGIHCAGLVIAPGALTDEMPLERSSKGLVISQFEMNAVSDVGLVKMDLLGSRALSALSDSVAAVRLGGIDLCVDSIPPDDAYTHALMSHGGTLGCFQLESPGMRTLLRVMKPNRFSDMIAAVSLFRPGPLEGGFKNAYLLRRMGEEEWEYIHPYMERVLAETYGVILYQEQFLRLVHELGGFDLGAAENLRKTLGKKPGENELAELRSGFVAATIRNGLSYEVAEAVWDVLLRYSGFGFCKGHAASYALVAYRSAYMKSHYPAEFMAAVLANEGGYYGAGAYVEEARRAGCTIAGPDVNRSEHDWTGRGSTLQVGFGAISGLAARTIGALLAARRDGHFRSLADLLERVGLNWREAETLIKVGALDRLSDGVTRRQLLWEARAWLAVESGQVATKTERGATQPGLPLDKGGVTAGLPEVTDYTPRQKAMLENHYLGFTLAARPLEFHEPELAKYGPIPSHQLDQHIDKSIVLAGRVIAGRRHITRNGEWLLFLSLEDDHGIMELVLFPKVYREYAEEISLGGPFVVRGNVDAQRHGEMTIVVEKLRSLNRSKGSKDEQNA